MPIQVKMIATFKDGSELHYANSIFNEEKNSISGVIYVDEGLKPDIVSGRNCWDWNEESKFHTVSSNADSRWAGKVIIKDEIELPDGSRESS